MKEALAKRREKRRKLIRVSPEMILDLLRVPSDGIRVGNVIVESVLDQIPDTARAICASVDELNNVVLLVEDESFPPIAEGLRFVTMNLMYRETPCNEGDDE